MSRVPNSSAGDVERLLRGVAADLTDLAETTWDVKEDGVSAVFFRPKNSGSCAFSVAWSAHEAVVGFDDGSRVELDPDGDQGGDLAEVVDAIINGQVFAQTKGRKSAVVVLGRDGKVFGSPLSGLIRPIGQHDYKSYRY